MSNCSHYTLPVALPSVLFTVVYIPRHPAHIHRFTTDNWRFFLHTYQSRKSLIFKLISSLASSSNPVYSTTSKRYAPMHTPKPFSRIQIFAYDLWKLRPPAYPCPHLALISYTKIRLPITTGKPTNPSTPLISSLLSPYAEVSFCILLGIKPSPLASIVLMDSFSK